MGILDAMGKLTKAKKEHRKTKGYCPYCGEFPTHHSKDCQYKELINQTAWAMFTLKSEPQVATIEEVSKISDQSDLEN